MVPCNVDCLRAVGAGRQRTDGGHGPATDTPRSGPLLKKQSKDFVNHQNNTIFMTNQLNGPITNPGMVTNHGYFLAFLAIWETKLCFSKLMIYFYSKRSQYHFLILLKPWKIYPCDGKVKVTPLYQFNINFHLVEIVVSPIRHLNHKTKRDYR